MFRPDSLFIRFLTKVCDLIILNILFMLMCVTVVFSGTAVTALYTMTFRMIQKKDGPLVKGYFRALRENFIPSVPASICLFVDVTLLAILRKALFAETLLFSPNIFVFLSIAAAFLTAVLSYIFPLLARYENTFRQHLGNAGRLAVVNLPVTVLLTAVNLLPVLLVLFFPQLLGVVAAFWMLIGFSAGAYVNTFYLNRIFNPKDKGDAA